MSKSIDARRPAAGLRRGWTTGACAAAAARAAYEALICGQFPDPVSIALPGGERPSFGLAFEEIGADFAAAGIVKDAGDDPDVTHGALVVARLRHGPSGSGVSFQAGPGVGVVTLAGLPLPPGEPAINPAPRRMISAAIDEAARRMGATGDVIVEISIPGGEQIAERTLNGRLGIIGGLSILGVTGVVIPYSCSAWIDSIHRSVDVARAAGIEHIAGATGSVSEAAVQTLHRLPEIALVEMGDFVGGLLKYLRRNPIPKVTVAGGFAKMTKLAQGLLDLHSSRGQVDLAWLADRCREIGANADLIERIKGANTAKEVADLASTNGVDLASEVAKAAWVTGARALRGADITLEIAVFDRDGSLLARTSFWPVG